MSILSVDDGEFLDFGFSSLRILLRAEETGGAFGLTEQTLEAGTLAGPSHTHANEIGFFYVLDGQIGVQLGEGVLVAGPHCTVSVPAGMRHTFWNPGDVPARVLELFTPAGFERWFEDLARLISQDPPDLDAIVASARRFGTEMDFDSLPDLMERYGLHFPGT
jgi:mannose-6-phosphate isomerase-like protein (cupin superfamily)